MKRCHFLRQAASAAACAVGASVLSIPNVTLAAKQVTARQLGLKITDARTFVMDAGGDENYVFVKIYTNQGLTGPGEGTLRSRALTIS